MSIKKQCKRDDCQKRCLECRDKNDQPFNKVDRDTYCPWYKNLIAPPKAPEAPKIRGFPDEKTINQESLEDLDIRVEKFKKWIYEREEQTIAVVSHGTFISRIIGFHLNNCEYEVWEPNNL